jgi:hypothetical protein
MQKFNLTILLILISFSCLSQINKETDNLIDSLSWNSITCDHSFHTFTVNYEDISVRKLIELGDSVVYRLLESIETPQKTVIIHMILTKILEPENSNDNLPIKYIYKDCNNLIGCHFIFNGLVWEWLRETNEIIETKEILKIKEYWTERIYNRAIPWFIDIEELFEKLSILDSIKYPCLKVYENNSSNLSFSDIQNVSIYDDFNDIFAILGNDSTISKYDDCFYVSYRSDGISFRFNQEEKLTSVFFYSNYLGEMPYNLKYTDTKDIVENKIGLPNKTRRYSTNKSVSYNKKKLHIDYNKDNEIIKLLITK